MVLRSLSYCRFSGTVRNDRSAALHPPKARSRRLCRADLCPGCCVVSYNPAVLQLDNAASIRGVSLGVCDLDDGRTRVIQTFEELHDLFALCGMEIPRRLIREDQFRTENHRARHADKLLLAAGELVREKVFLANDVEAIERVANQAYAFFVRHVFVGERDFQVLEYRQIVDQVIALKHEPDVRFMQLVAFLDVELMHCFAQEVVVAAPRPIEHSDDAQQRGLSRPRGAHNRDKLARLNIQIDSAQEIKFIRPGLDNFFQISQLNQWLHNFSLPHCRESEQQHSKSLSVSL